jgi:hypothetical protein
MFVIDSDLTIHITRGDSGLIAVTAGIGETDYEFKIGDVVRFKVMAKKNCADVMLQKDIEVTEPTSAVEVALESEDTKFGGYISKPTDYWYEVELNPDTKPQTIIGYDENGAKVFKLYPEGGVADE